MDCVKTGRLIAKLRKEKELTQQEIADVLGISNKTVSKWETGLGCPDLSLWPELSVILGVDMAQLMEGEITPNKPDSGNINRIRFYVCPICGNILISTGGAYIACCGRTLTPLTVSDCQPPKIAVEEADMDYYITFEHEMTKEHYISFAAYVKTDSIYLYRMYPEQSPSLRIPMIRGGKLYIHCVKHGLSLCEI
ncbi:hypothetical protein IMSAG049_00274 [Clostridiales bacterium]|nr:hypothetical protein IMSAG049_00274 [Clostridiales bacterium]